MDHSSQVVESTEQRAPRSSGLMISNENNRTPRIFIPDLLVRWPWPRQVHPDYEDLKKQSDAWVKSLNAYTPKVQKVVDQSDFALLACLGRPIGSKEQAKVVCDLTHFTFVIDAYADKVTPSEIGRHKHMILDAFQHHHTPRPKGESILGEMARQFWLNNMHKSTKTSQKRFIQHIDQYLEGRMQRAIDRDRRSILNIESYLALRQSAVGITPFFSINELGLDIPDEVMAHTAVKTMSQAAIGMIICCNDIFSYNIEQTRGDEFHNILTCVMHEHRTDVNGAILWTADYMFRLEERFLTALASLPRWEEPLDSQVKEYCNGFAHWVRGFYEWSFESTRYLGCKGAEVRKNKWMSLLPRKTPSSEIGPVEIDSSLL